MARPADCGLRPCPSPEIMFARSHQLHVCKPGRVRAQWPEIFRGAPSDGADRPGDRWSRRINPLASTSSGSAAHDRRRDRDADRERSRCQRRQPASSHVLRSERARRRAQRQPPRVSEPSQIATIRIWITVVCGARPLPDSAVSERVCGLQNPVPAPGASAVAWGCDRGQVAARARSSAVVGRCGVSNGARTRAAEEPSSARRSTPGCALRGFPYSDAAQRTRRHPSTA